MDGVRRLAIAVAAALALTLPAASDAKVTIGSDLSGTPRTDTANGTWVNSAIETGRRATGGLRSPVNGTVVRWRIRTGEHTATVTPRVIRPLGGGLYTGAGTGPAVIPALDAISIFPVHLRISRGDLIGNDTIGGLVTQLDDNASPDQSQLLLWFAPPLSDGNPGMHPNVNAGGRVSLINADIRPTAKFKVKRAKLLRGGRVWVALKLPNPGTLRVGGVRVPITAPGWRTMVVRPQLGAGGSFAISFRPAHGKAFTRVVHPTAA